MRSNDKRFLHVKRYQCSPYPGPAIECQTVFQLPDERMGMSRHALVVMDRTEASENALEYTIAEYPDATISVIPVTGTSDPLGLFGDRDPSEFVIPDCEFDLDDELIPDTNSFTRAQRKRAEHVFDRACTLSEQYDREVEPVVRSGEPVEEIVTYAEEQAVDHIVIAEYRRTALCPLLRSVSESLAKNASIPITILRLTDKDRCSLLSLLADPHERSAENCYNGPYESRQLLRRTRLSVLPALEFWTQFDRAREILVQDFAH